MLRRRLCAQSRCLIWRSQWPRFLRTPEAATYLGLSARTLEKHRTYGNGPVYRELGSRIVYRIDELEAWAGLGTRRSTSDPGKGIVYPAKPLPEAVRKTRSTRCS